jgi:hypothetical protein
MSAFDLVQSLDKEQLTPLQYGENKHLEYGWSKMMREKVLQFYFQLIRTSDLTNLNKIHYSILEEIYDTNNKDMKNIMLKIIVQTRDIVKGKGEYNLTFMQIYNLSFFDIEKCKKIINYMVGYDCDLDIPYGSWKDIKYLYNYIVEKPQRENSKVLINHLIFISNDQLYKDLQDYNENKQISLISKWIPRENSSFKNLFDLLAINYYATDFNLDVEIMKESSINYAKMYYRKVLSKLNKYIDTAQIKMCKKQWNTLNFNKLTSITINKQKYALNFVEKNGNERSIYDNNIKDKQDRIQCKERFAAWQKSKSSIKGKNVSVYDYVKSAIQFIYHPNKDLEELLNKQWEDNLNNQEIGDVGNVFTMVDVSGSMEVDNFIPLYNAIGLGIRIAEKSKLGNRCLTFSNEPNWVILDDLSFTQKVQILKNSDWGGTTNLVEAMNKILYHIEINKIKQSEIDEMILIVLSDMQFNEEQHNLCIDKSIEEKFAEVGKKICNIPYKPPKIVFWNLRSTQGFPSLSYHPGVSMISGSSPYLIDSFVNKGLKGIEEYNPYNVLEGILNEERYEVIL